MADVFTSAGEAFVVDLIDDTTTTVAYAIGWGTGSGGAVKTDVSLSVEVTQRVTLTAGAITQSSVDTNQFVATLTSGATQTITEVGLFEGAVAPNGTLVIRSDFTGIALVSGDKIEFTIQLQQT